MCAISSVLPSPAGVAHVVGGDHAGHAGLGLDHDLLAPHPGELLADDAASASVPPPGGKPTTMRTGARRPGLGAKAGQAERGRAPAPAWRRGVFS
jgi:hypothetical protein